MEKILEKLTPEQSEIALRIADEALKMGIDPRLAVALAYQESKFDPNVRGKDGEIGIMQVMPATGKMLGFSVDDLKDLNKNIQAGLTYLKQSLDQHKDPVAAAAGYNAGIDHLYFKDPNKNQLPESTIKYLEGIRDIGGFTATPTEEPAADSGDAGANLEAKKRAAANVLGAVGGATLGAGIDVGRRVFPAVARGVSNLVTSTPAAPQVTPQASSQAAPQTAGAQAARPVAGGPAGPVGGPASTAPSVVRQGGSGTFNYGKAFGLTDIEAARALDMSKQAGGAQDLITQRREALQRLGQMFPSDQFVENPRYGGLMTPERGVGGGPRASFTQTPSGLSQLPPTKPIPSAVPQPGALSQMSQAVKRRAGAIARSPVGGATVGALGGLSLVSQGSELYDRYLAEDVPGMAISGAGTVGGALQLIPGPSRPVGITMSALSALLMPIYDKIRSEPNPLAATEEELREAAKPAFVRPMMGRRYALP